MLLQMPLKFQNRPRRQHMTVILFDKKKSLKRHICLSMKGKRIYFNDIRLVVHQLRDVGGNSESRKMFFSHESADMNIFQYIFHFESAHFLFVKILSNDNNCKR